MCMMCINLQIVEKESTVDGQSHASGSDTVTITALAKSRHAYYYTFSNSNSESSENSVVLLSFQHNLLNFELKKLQIHL